MSDIADMNLFCRIADLGNLSAAGRELRLSTALVSHRLGKLEDRLGVSLFNRTTRRVALTEEGLLYYDYCQGVLAATGDFEDRIALRRDAISGLIRVNAPKLLGRTLLAPLLAAFQASHPDCDIRCSLGDDYSDPVAGDFDILLRIGETPDSALIARRLGQEQRLLAAAPSYLAKHSAPGQISDLSAHNCLLLRFPGSRQFRWRFDKNGQTETQTLSGSMDSDDPAMLLAWAEAGQGIVMVPRWYFRQFGHGLVELPLQDAVVQSEQVNLLWAANRFHPPRFRALADFLDRHLADVFA